MASRIGRLTAVGIVVGLTLGGLGTGTAHAAKPVITAQGDVACQGSGKVKAQGFGAPPNFTAQLAAKLAMKCFGPTGHPTVTIKKAKVSGVLSHKGGCTPNGRWTFSISYKGDGGKIVSTSVVYSNSQVTPTGWVAPGPGGTATVNGSYASTNGSSINISGPSSTIQGWCGQTPGRKPPRLVGFMSFNLFM